MNARSLVFGWMVFIGVGPLSAAVPLPPRVEADVGFRVCVVDEAQSKDAPDRAALRARVVACLQQTVGAEWREVREERVPTEVAAKRFKASGCDAVIFFGPKRPRKLRRLDAVTFAVDLGPKRDYEPVYLIVPAREKRLQKTILTAFPKAFAPLHPPTLMLAAQ